MEKVSTEIATVVVIGTGLIGTSIALALREKGTTVYLADRDPGAVALAEELGAGVRFHGGARIGNGNLAREPADLAVLAAPPDVVPRELFDAQREAIARCYTDVASVKARPVALAQELGCDLETFIGGHPMAGRERSGPAAARSDLFLGRPWVLCPTAETAPETVGAATALVRMCGAEPVRLDPQAHDRAVALVSHAPHLVASAVAARLRDAPDAALGLAGQGLRDVTRIAAGDASLWTAILTSNANAVAEVLEATAADLSDAAKSLRASGERPPDDAEAITDLLRRGNTGHARIPGKRGGPAPAYTVVSVVIRDQPGELARLFLAAGEAGVNIEDVTLEHSPGLPVGVAELSVKPDRALALSAALRAGGWSVPS